MATNYAINYDDKRFQEVKNQEATAVKETQGTYDKMVNQSDSFYQQQIDASKDWANKQSEIQQAQTDFAIEKVEQAKDQAKKNYTKEQKGAYTDYQKATNEYGANAETLAAQGLNQTGYSESTRTSAYNTYQNRYMTARESYNQAILNYDNNIKEAQLANSSALAKIAYEALQQQLELSLQGFQYKNTLLLQKLEAVNQTKDRYYNRYQDVLQQINTENAMAEQIRQYNESLAEQKRQYNETLAFQKSEAARQQSNWQKEYNLAKSKASSSGSSGGSAKLTSGSSSKSSSSKSGSSSLSSSSSKSSSSLSENGKKILEAAELTYNTANKVPAYMNTAAGNAAKAVTIDKVNAAYQQGYINQNDVKTILKRLEELN